MENSSGLDFRLAFISRTTTSPFRSGNSSTLADGGSGGCMAYKGCPWGRSPPWLGRLGRVLLVRIVKNVVVVYSSANSLNASYW